MDNNKYMFAITGPSGVGKTTLASLLTQRFEIGIPMHCTTRSRRNDDPEKFYRYLTHEEFKSYAELQKFLLWSGDSTLIDKSLGNYYGILSADCEECFVNYNSIILFVSYKDISTINVMKSMGLNIFIINLKYDNINNEMHKRLEESKQRNHTQSDILSRIRCAVEYERNYGDLLDSSSNCIIYTDKNSIESTFNKVVSSLNIEEFVRKRK